jgi:gliding motility-associated-like protein
MKKLVLLILVAFFTNQLFSQSTCASSAAFCAGQSGTTFPAGVNNGSAAAGPDYGCLGSQPNPAWYFFQVSQSGSINIAINGTGGGDVDFICWGPFPSQTAACSNLTAANTIDCSYSASPTETCSITNAVSGQYYMLLLTNYSNQTQNINFNQTGGTGSTNCGLLTSVISQTICAGRTATLSVNSNVTNPTYVWNPGGATTSSIVVSPSVTTVYSVTTSGTNAGGTPTVITNSGTVTVNTVPNFTVGTNSPVCQGSSVTFTATAALGNYTWTGPPINSVTALGSLTLPNSNTNMAGTYTVTGKTAQGCTVSATTSVTVIGTGSVAVVPTTTVCQGSAILLTSSSVPVATTYSWTGPSSYTSAVQNPTITNAQPSQSGTYTVTAGFTSGSKTCVKTNTCSVTVNAMPTVTLASNSILCQGATLNLTSTPGLASYTWTGPPALNQVTALNSISIPNAEPTTMAGNYTVTAKTAQGCTSSATTSVGIIATGTIAVVPTTTVCENENVFLTANSTPLATVYNWTGPNGFATAVQNPTLTNAVPLQSGTYTVIADFTMGGKTCTMSAVSDVTISALPAVSITGNGPVCQGNDIKLNSAAGSAAYTWTGPAGLNQTTTADSLIIGNANAGMQGNYTVLAQSAEGCTATATASVEVIQTGSVTVTPSFTACQGGVINLTASSSPVANSYDWTGPLSYTANTPNPVLNNVMPGQSGVYTVTASFTSGTVTCTMTNASTVTIIAAPVVNLNPIPTVCNNGNINLVAPNGGSSYLWTGPNSYTSSAQNPVIPNASVANAGTYSLTITSSGCVNTGNITINVFPVLNFLSLPTGTTLCAGKTGYLISSGGAGGSGSYNYSWSPTTGLSSPNAAATGVTGVTTTDYTLTLSDANCPVTIAPTAVASVIVNPTPVITMSTSINRGCEPFCTDLIGSSVPPSVNCVWQFSNSTGMNACGTPNFCFPMHGAYDASLTVTDVNGCVDSVRQSSFIIVDPKPEPSFDYFPANPTVLINEVNYNDQSTVGAPMQNWHWNFGDYNVSEQNDTANVQNPSHVYDYPGTYTVNLEVTNSFGCTDNVSRIVVVEEEFALYIPNAFTPSKAEGKNDVFMIQGMGFLPDGFEMRIYDRWGELVFKTNDINTGWDGKIKGGALGKEGVYVYKILIQDTKNREKEFVGHINLL